jgi:DNA primase
MRHPNFLLQEARQLDIVGYLEKLGHHPQKIRNNDYWYLSPLREEKEASFKVHRKLNVWYDHGLGKGGNIIDLGILYHNCSFKEAMEKLQEVFSFHLQTSTVQHYAGTQNRRDNALEPAIKVIAAKPITHPALCRYLDARKIPLEIAKQYCKEIDFEVHNRRYFAIGFENKSRGFELRNEFFKGSSSPKNVTIIDHPDSKNVAVFEGFFSFLSYQTLHQNNSHSLIKLTERQSTFLVLNSLSFFEKSRNLMEKKQKVYLYLDRDDAGIKHMNQALKWASKYIDRSHLYKNSKDLNEYLGLGSMEQKKEHKLKIHL